jgi:light-harvesting complex I chlorophyll a/b binding protein 1
MSESLPFLPCPEKLDGSMPGDVGFDPMGLSEIQQDLTYARWAELKHGRIAMLAIVGLITQTYIHLPGEAYTNSDPFGAVSTVGLGVNLQIFAGIGVVELANFYKHYDGSTPGDIGFDGGFLKKKSPEQIAKLKEQEIKHCRLAMVAITGASVQTLMFHQPLLG